MENFKHRKPDEKKVQETNLYKNAPEELQYQLDNDPNFLRDMVYHLAAEQDDGSLLVYPFLASGNRHDDHLADFYNSADETSREYIDELCAEFIQKRKDQLAAHGAVYETGEDWNGDVSSPPRSVVRSGFQREPKFVYDRLRHLRGENHDARPFDPDSLKRESRYGEVFDRYYQGNQAFRQYADKMYREYPSLRRQEEDKRWREHQMRQEREQEALTSAKKEIQEKLASLRAAGHSREAIEQMLRSILREN